MQLFTITQYQVHMTLIFSRLLTHGFKDQGHRLHFLKMHFPGRLEEATKDQLF